MKARSPRLAFGDEPRRSVLKNAAGSGNIIARISLRQSTWANRRHLGQVPPETRCRLADRSSERYIQELGTQPAHLAGVIRVYWGATGLSLMRAIQWPLPFQVRHRSGETSRLPRNIKRSLRGWREIQVGAACRRNRYSARRMSASLADLVRLTTPHSRCRSHDARAPAVGTFVLVRTAEGFARPLGGKANSDVFD